MRLKIRKISTAELLVMFFMFVLSGAMYTLPTTSYTNSKLLSVAVVFVFMFFLKGKIKLKGTYSRFIVCFLSFVIILAFYSMIIHSEMPTDVFNICGGYFALIGYVLVQNLTISKEQIQKIFVNYTKLIVLFFFIQYAIFKISGNIIFIDFYNPQMRAGFLRAGVGSEFVALSIIIMFAEFLQTYRKKKRFDIKLIIWMGIFSVYFVLFICIRAAILAIFLSCLVLVFIGTDSRKLKLGILLLGVLGGALILQSSVFDKYMQIDKIEGGGSITGRLAMYAYYFNGFMQHPIMGQGFIKPINSALTTLLYGPYGFYYLEDVGIVGCLFTFGLVGVFLFLTFITKGMKTIISGYKDRSIFSDSVVLGVFMFLVFTMPTLFLFDYARNLYTVIFRKKGRKRKRLIHLRNQNQSYCTNQITSFRKDRLSGFSTSMLVGLDIS